MQSAVIPPEVVKIVRGISTEIINPLIAVIFAAALVYFLYGLLMFILNAGDAAKREEGKAHMVWGLIGLTVMVSVYTILSIGLKTMGVTSSDVPSELIGTGKINI